MASETEMIQRQVLLIPDRQHVGLTTYDAKDLDTKYPPIEPCGRLRTRSTCSSSCSMMWASARRVRSTDRSRHRPPECSTRRIMGINEGKVPAGIIVFYAGAVDTPVPVIQAR
jgi:hypothetical protein